VERLSVAVFGELSAEFPLPARPSTTSNSARSQDGRTTQPSSWTRWKSPSC